LFPSDTLLTPNCKSNLDAFKRFKPEAPWCFWFLYYPLNGPFLTFIISCIFPHSGTWVETQVRSLA
jgi:hypothetical protein